MQELLKQHSSYAVTRTQQSTTSTYTPRPSASSTTSTVTQPTTSSQGSVKAATSVPAADWRPNRIPAKHVICWKCRKPGHVSTQCTSPVNIGAMDWSQLQIHFSQQQPTPTTSVVAASQVSSSSSIPTTVSASSTSTSTSTASVKDFA